MRKTIKFLFFVIASAAVTLNSFAQTADVNEGCLPLKVKFTPPLGKSTYYWDFKDGVTSVLATPSNIFSKGGTYNVTYQETPTGPVLGTVKITVFEKPVLTISVPPGCAPLNAQFSNTTQLNTAIKVSKYTWVWGDGLSSSGPDLKNASHLYSQVNKYSVSASIETQYPSCNVTTIFNNVVEVIAPPVALFSTNPSPAATCKDTLKVDFINKSTGVKPLTYSWNLGAGKTSALLTPPQQQYIKGQFSPSLTVSYTGITGCSAGYSQTVSAGSPQPTIVLDKKDSVCFGVGTAMKTKSPGVYSWTFDAGSTPSSTTQDSINVFFSTPGIHQVTLKVTSFDGKCSGTKTANIFVDKVTAAISASNTFGCKSPTTNTYAAVTNLATSVAIYSWTNTSNTTKGISATYINTVKSKGDSSYYGKNGFESYATMLSVTSKQTGCSAGATKTDTLWLPNALLKPDKLNGCMPLPVTFTDSSTTAASNPIVKWQWIFGDGTTVSATDKNPVTHSYITAGTYKARLLVTTLKGCTDTSYAYTIEVGDNLTSKIDFTADKASVCPDETISFSSKISAQTAALIDAYHFSTEGNRLFHCSSQNAVSWSYKDLAGPQDVALTVDYNGCLSTLNKPALVTVKGAVAKIDYTALCSQPLTYNYVSKSTNATSVKWIFGKGQESANATESHTYATVGDYTVILEAQDASSGCSPNRDMATIHVRQLEAVIDVKSKGLICANIDHSFDASASKDVDSKCYSGYTWSFPTISDKRPLTTNNAAATFQFAKKGTHTVQLVVKDINGCKDTATALFKVYDMAPGIISDVAKLCITNDVQFTDKTVSDTTVVKWDWNFGDNNTSILQSPKHTYSTPSANNTNYSVKLTLTDALGCQRDTTVFIDYYKPSTIVSISKPNHCFGDTISVSASDYTAQGSNLSFSWDFGNGSVSTKQSNKVIYNAAQPHAVKLVYKELSSGCVDSVITPVDVQSYPIAYIQTDVDKALKYLCADKNITFTDSSQTTFPLTQRWDFGNGQTSTLNTFALFYPKGTFKTTHIVSTSYGCADTATVSYTIVRPEGDFDIDKQTICKGDSIRFNVKNMVNVSSYSWIYGDGIIENNISPVKHKYNFHPTGGSTKATLLLRGYEDQCPWPVAKIISIRKVIAEFDRLEGGTDTTLCVSEGLYNLSNTSVGNSSYMWDFGDGKTSSTDMKPAHFYPPGIYNVQMSVQDNQFNCKDTIVKKVIVYANPKLSVTSDTVCLGNILNVKVIKPESANKYLWTPATGLAKDTDTTQVISLSRTINYTVVTTDTNTTCTDTAVSRAIVIEPIGLQDFDTTIVIGDKVILPVYASQDVYKFNWTPTKWLSCTACNYPVAQPIEDIDYKLEVSDFKSCFNNTYNFKIIVKPETFVKLPTLFTPNGDGNNDVVSVKGWGIKELVNFSVYNRWGQLLYSSSNIDEGWDGKYDGALQSNDVYIYKVKAKTWREEEILKEGYINLLR